VEDEAAIREVVRLHLERRLDASPATVVCAIEIAAVCPWNAADAAICTVPLPSCCKPILPLP
jgi:hypothetical protein